MSRKTELPIYSDEILRGVRDRLSRIEGQVRGVARMVEAQRRCVEVLNQLSSIEAALRGVSKTVLRNYLESCATEAIRSGDSEVYDEVMDVIFKFAR